MSKKTQIVAALGEHTLLLPFLLNEALAANDRAKYRLTLLQTALSQAQSPDRTGSDLRMERLACGVMDSSLDEVVANTTKSGGDTYAVPHALAICNGLARDLETMTAPFEAAQLPEGAMFRQRMSELSASPWCGEDGTVTGRGIAQLASADPARGDSVHLLVMDMHKALNRLQGEVASESVDGAVVYGLRSEDRAFVAAFMKGVNRTLPLKLDHPGLETTATRMGQRLVLQNDIGTTDAHVLVVHVEAKQVTVTYSDSHLQRLLFFRGMFAQWSVEWGEVRSLTDQNFKGGVYHLNVGLYRARDRGDLKAYLTHLGSRLVYLIDWNRARKRLQSLVPKSDALALLSWSAENDIGHMGFLKAGGERMVFEALQSAAGGTLSYGVTLSEMLGREAAITCLRFILGACSRGLLERRPLALIRDEARVELSGYYQYAQQGLFDLASDHASLAVEIAAGIRDGLLDTIRPNATAYFERLGERAKKYERRADELVIRARELTRQSELADAVRQLLETADDIPDELEEAVFHLTLLEPGTMAEEIRLPLAALARLLVQGTQEYLKAVENARGIHRSSSKNDMHDFLESIHRIAVIEQESDMMERAVRKVLVSVTLDYRQALVIAGCARNLEAAADALMHAGMVLRDQTLSRLTER